jgi:hypothetical protein
MPAIIPLTGLGFGRWRVLEREFVPSRPGSTLYRCRCDCGVERLVLAGHLRSGASTSCGCGQKHPTTHGESRGGKSTKEYRTWRAMRNRCLNERGRDYKWYGARGIKVTYRTFGEFLADVGRAPTVRHTIDRINNDGNYSPGNCRWLLLADQHRNQRTTKGLRYERRRRE